MRTSRLSLVGTVILTLLGGVGGVVAAQTEDEPGPDAFFTGALLSQQADMTEMETSEGDGVEHLRGVRNIERHEWSDPRLPGDGRSIVNWDIHEAGVAIGSAVLLEGPDGYWTGTATSFCDHETYCRGMTLLTGHETYEGLTALIASGSDAGGPDGLPEWESEGFIFPSVPPVPELPAE